MASDNDGPVNVAIASSQQTISTVDRVSLTPLDESPGVVAPGDTLWAIASSLAPDTDPRPLAAALADIAGGTELQPGQRIVVPASLLG